MLYAIESMRSKLIIGVLFAALSIQAQETLRYPLDTINGEEVYRYQVEKGIGLYRIGINFNVPQSDIVRLNPQLRERGLHYAETLLIPTGRKVEKKEKKELKAESLALKEVAKLKVDTVAVVEMAAVAKDTVAPAADTILVEPDTILAEPDNRRVVELALMLPFESQQTKRSSNAERMLAFYQGALLALHDLQNDSTLYRLRVYDTERSERRVQALCDSTELDSVQAILGLVYPIQIARMATWCEARQVPLFLPFSDDIDLASHPHLFQFNSTDQQEADSLCAWLQAQGESIHVVATTVREAEMSGSVRILRNRLLANGISCTSLPLRDLMNDSAAYALDPEKENIILLHSDRYQQVRIVLPHVATLRNVGYTVRLISQYSWQKEHIGLPQVFTSMFTADESREAYDTLWSQTYAGGHVSENPRYDLLGYDLMRAMVAWLRGEQETKGLQSDIRWTQTNNAGWQNACVRVVTY